MADDPVRTALEEDELQAIAREAAAKGEIAAIAASYSRESDRLLGFVLNMSYDELTLVTCDAWKRKCGGVPKNSFVLLRLNLAAAALAPEETPDPFLILARVLDAASVPLSQEVQQTIFQIHKVQATIDPYTNADLQWGALKASILGTYFDSDAEVDFGSDIDTYVSPHFYEVYVPRPEDLELLVNSFVSSKNPVEIGRLRYTETKTSQPTWGVPIRVSPRDFVANRTALFGKTRMGKSNTIKVIADMMIRSGEHIGQVIFDLDGEYSNPNEQDGTSLFQMHVDACVRYGLNPAARVIPGVPDPRRLKVNFFGQVSLGHQIMTSLWDDVNRLRPNYVLPLLEWDPCDPSDVNVRFPDVGDRTRYVRAQSMYFAALAKAGFGNANPTVELNLHAALKQQLATDPRVAAVAKMKAGTTAEIADRQQLGVVVRIYEALWELYNANSRNSQLFPASGRSGAPYFDNIHICLLRMIGDRGVSGIQYLIQFNRYHDLGGSHLLDEIVTEVNIGKTVIIDLANADELVARFYSELVSRAVFSSQVAKFTAGTFGEHSVLFYFEEAHNLFRRDDNDLTSIYNRLAKEGAKNRIGMVYATQSMTTLSPDLLKNTENFFIAHLSDDREIHELTYRYEFKDIGLDVQRCKTRGYVRMITLSHRYALPVQIKRFVPLPEHGLGAAGDGPMPRAAPESEA